jgi:hypothetical protein
MRQYVGQGWYIHHKTERTIELRKPDPAYWTILGGDGYVLHRIEPGLVDKESLVDGALKKALATDEDLSRRIAEQLIPEARKVQAYRRKQAVYAKAFGTPEDESQIGRKRC